jgi:recombination protein RecA
MPTKAEQKKSSAVMKSALAKFDEKFQKEYGEGTLTSDEIKPYEVIPTGSLALDYALGVGGWVLGRETEVWGADAIGKTTLVIQSVREAQRKFPDRLVFWVDAEHTFDKPWARLHGVDLTRLRVFAPESAEDVADAVKDAVRSGLFVLVVVDSIGAMIPEAEKEKDADGVVMAAQAKIVTRMVKIAAVECANHNAALVLINQVRANVSGFGKATMTGGGWALRHSTTHKVELKRTDKAFKIKQEGREQEVGHEVACMVERNKVAPPKKRASFVLFHTPTSKYGPAGFDKADEVATMGIKTGVIAQTGAWYTFSTTGEKVNGRDAVVDALRAMGQEHMDEIRERVLATIADQIVTGAEAEVDLEADDEIDLSHLVGTGTGLYDTEAKES